MRVKPIFTYTLVASALALPAPAYSLALGKLTVNSALGEPLSAQIELAAVTREELESLTAKVADATLYRQNNLGYQAVLSRARIAVERTPDGRAILKVTSPTPVNEPYLDLLVEVNWATGRVVRDYTFLLDPPGTGVQVAVEPATPSRQAPVTTAAAAARPAPIGAPGAGHPADGRLRGASRRHAVEDRVGLQARRCLARTDAGRAVQRQYRSVRRQQHEPAALGCDRHRAERGERGGHARRARRRRSSASRPPTGAPIAISVAASAPSVAGGGGREAGGRISAAAEDKAGAVPPGRDQVRISREAGVAKGGAGAEDSVARSKQLADAQARIAELEKTVRDMQRAVELKSAPLAAAQAQADAAKAKAPGRRWPRRLKPEPPKAAEPAKAPEPAKAQAPAPTPIPPQAEPPKAIEPAKVAEAPKVEPPKAAEPAKAPEPAKAVEAPKAAEPAPVAAAPAPPKARPSRSPRPRHRRRPSRRSSRS